MANRIVDDERPILRAWSECGQVGASVGQPRNAPVTKIEPYEENGQMAAVTWLRVWKGDAIVARLNAAKMAEIVYQND